jgi:primosomal protein N' (replication factor Y) (superfamily II helicase)
VLPDVPAVDRAFDYEVPGTLGAPLAPGTMVRITLAGRRVGGWVLAEPPDASLAVRLSSVHKVVGKGPDEEMIELCRWVAWRWAGRLATLLRLASPDRAVPEVGPFGVVPAVGGEPDPHAAALLRSGPGVHVLQVPPTADPLGPAVAAAALGQALIVVPSVAAGAALHSGLRACGASVARWPAGWAAAAAGATVVGGRSTVFAPAPGLAAIVVIDEHDEGLQSESSPTWNAREIAVERARRAGIPCLLVSPAPSLEARGSALEVPRVVVRSPRAEERAGWAPTTVVDRRGEDTGRTGLFSTQLVEAVRETARSGRRVLCLLNRTGRARLLVCRSCGSVARCDSCGSSVRLGDDLLCHCPSCGASRPGVCLECGSSALSGFRPGVTRAGEELQALALEPVDVVTGADPSSSGARVVIGTEAVLHRFGDAGLVAFVDFDQELLAPRYRTAEEALALVVLASRLVGGRSRGGRVLLQTRLPEHEVVRAVMRADPGMVARAEADRRRLLGFPPFATLVAIAGEAAPEYIRRLGEPLGVDVLGPDDDRWLLRARDRESLLDHLATIQRPPGRLRLQVDPARIR